MSGDRFKVDREMALTIDEYYRLTADRTRPLTLSQHMSNARATNWRTEQEQTVTSPLDRVLGVIEQTGGDREQRARSIMARISVGDDLSLCGTNAGYHEHVNSGERPCGGCRSAHARYERDRRIERRKGAA